MRRVDRKSERLHVIPCELGEANAFVRQHHRHHGPVQGHRFSLAVCTEDEVVRGVAVVGRPTARRSDDGWTLEVTRLATDGTANACSALYGAARRAAFALGYRKVITFVLDTESGHSLASSGWKCIGLRGGLSWNVPSRPRVDKHPAQMKFRWEATS
jgi:hypothetical protein